MIWNFPENSDEKFIFEVFLSAQELQIGEIHLTINYRAENKIPQITEQPNSDFQYKYAIVFDQALYFGYRNEDDLKNAKTYIFENITFYNENQQNDKMTGSGPQFQSYFVENAQKLEFRDEKLL